MTPKIPAGWRRLRVGTRIQKGDKWMANECPTKPVWNWAYWQGGQIPVYSGECVIRRIRKPASARRHP
jgi:hypothetical protein